MNVYRKDFLDYYAKHYLQYERLIETLQNIFIFFQKIKKSILINRKNKLFRIQQTDLKINKVEQYLQNFIMANFQKLTFEKI